MPVPIAAIRPKGLVSASFTPASLAPHLWLDPSDLTTLFQTNGGTAVSAADDPVGQMVNKGSVADSFVSALTNRPLYKNAGGLRRLKFDGVDDFLLGSAISNYMTATTYDVVCAGIISTITDDAANIFDNDALYCDQGNGFFALQFRSSGPMLGVNYDGNYDAPSDTYVAGAAFVAHIRHSGGNLSLTLNGNATVTVASGGTSNITQLLRLAQNYSPIFTECEFYGLFCRKTLLAAGELAALKTWMGAKVGVVL